MLFHPTFVVQLCLFASAAQAADLLTTLRTVNASLFADAIQADPVLTSIFLASNVRTVFAPVDSVMSGIPFAKRALWIRDKTREDQTKISFHAAETELKAQAELSIPGDQLETASDLVPAKRKGRKQGMITDTGLREAPGLPSNGSTVMRRKASREPSLKVFTGLGHNVTVLQQRIPYDCGFVYTVDGLFTIPTNLSATARTRPETSTFATHLHSTNLTARLDSAESSTFFLPSNAAWNGTSSVSPSLLLGHAVQNFEGYLPALRNGQTLTTIGGGNLTVTIRGGEYYINGARIVSSNLILENGVAHIIDKVLTSPVVFTGAGASVLWGSIWSVGALAVSGALIAMFAA